MMHDSDKVMDINIGPLFEEEVPMADRIFRLAFGTFLGLADPMTFFGDADYVRTRLLADPSGALAAKTNSGELVGFNFVTNWGSVGFFGPLVVHPKYWDKGIGKRLLEPTMDIFKERGNKHLGLFTFAQSPKHVALYQKFGFWPRFLTAVMSKPVDIGEKRYDTITNSKNWYWDKYSEEDESDQQEVVNQCRSVTNSVYEGLDLQHEIRAIRNHNLGDTLLLRSRKKQGKVVGLAACHSGPGTEAGSGSCYIKFGAVYSEPNKEQTFEGLLSACELFAKEKGLSRIVAGVNTGRSELYKKMLYYGFRSDMQGISMHKPNEPSYDLADIYTIDDWR